jgi:hypothetical protein
MGNVKIRHKQEIHPRYSDHPLDEAMNLRGNSKRVYSRWKSFVSRHFLAVLFVTLILLQPVIWLVVRSLENTPLFYRCSSHDYPCGVVAQPEPTERVNDFETAGV